MMASNSNKKPIAMASFLNSGVISIVLNFSLVVFAKSPLMSKPVIIISCSPLGNPFTIICGVPLKTIS